jgi:hypothetical protein
VKKDILMKNNGIRDFEGLTDKVKITVSKKIKEIHPVVKNIIGNLAKLEFIHFIRLSPNYLQASNELTEGRVKIPITKPEHPTAVGVYLIIDIARKDIQFYEINSVVKGCGGKMVDEVLKALPKNWTGVVGMDWSNGFWNKMAEKYNNLIIL